jgi:DNA-binding transcriptional ArsR family regulator
MAAMPAHACFVHQPSRLVAELAWLPAEVRRFVQLCDGTRSVAELRADSGLSRPTVEIALAKLERLGVVFPDRRGARQRPPVKLEVIEPAPAFSIDEEPCFARSIDYLFDANVGSVVRFSVL